MDRFLLVGRRAMGRWCVGVVASWVVPACANEDDPQTSDARIIEAGTEAGNGAAQGDAGAGFATPVPVSVSEPNDAGAPIMDTELDEPTADNPIGYCAEAVALGDTLLVDDFEDGDLETLRVDNRAGRWFTYDDATPGGTLSLQMEPSDAESMALHVVSKGWSEWGSGIGVTMRFTVTGEEICYYDASQYDGIRFLAKGTGAPRLAVAEPSTTPIESGGVCSPALSCYDHHGISVALTETWVEYRFRFDELQQAGWGIAVGPANPSELFAIHFQMGASRDSDIWIDDLGFFRLGDESADAGAQRDAGGSTEEAGLSSGDAAVPRVNPLPDGDSGHAGGLDASTASAGDAASFDGQVPDGGT